MYQNCKIWIQNHKFLNLSGLCIIEDEKSYRSDIKKIDLIEYRRKRNNWKNNQKFQLEKEEYDKLVDFIPCVLSYVETFKKTCIINDECTVENERSEIE